MAYKHAIRWNVEDVRIVLVDEVTEGGVVTVEVSAGGACLLIMGEIEEDSRRLVATGVHVSSTGVDPNEVGIVNLRQIAKAIMEMGDYDEIVVEGAVRTTGAHPGHKPRAIRLARSRVAAPEPGSRPDKVG